MYVYVQVSTSNVISILIIRTNYDSSVKVRVLSQRGGSGGWGGQLFSDWSKIQDGGWKAVF